jgi:hypothetical protein
VLRVEDESCTAADVPVVAWLWDLSSS